ncbi:MAG: hypothetical protein KDC12_02415 [Flavobacteriales bacterium]|nr:hypothetical protein [Flavobacteriales bacterium]
MDKKLTLSLNENVIEQAKMYARANDISLSKLIEMYLASLTRKKKVANDITPLVKSLSGIIDDPKEAEDKNAYTNYLIEKYK